MNDDGLNGIDASVYCTDSARAAHPADFKIAAEWRAGDTRELKTFGFADEICLERVFRDAAARASCIRLAEGEELGPIGIYRLNQKAHDKELPRLLELEARFSAKKND